LLRKESFMIVTIHQPEHLPWLGFFDKVRQADLWVMLDHVQYRKNYYHNRNKIRVDNGVVWLTVPVLTKGNFGQRINEVKVNKEGSPRWKEKCWTSIAQHYRKAAFWRDHEVFIHDLYNLEWKDLVDINEFAIKYMLAALSINVGMTKSSDLNVNGHGTGLILNICRDIGADMYLSGVSGKDYLDLSMFADAGVEVCFQEFHHPIYRQLYDPFIPCMSAIDLLLNYGPSSLDVIKGIGVGTIDPVFE